MSNIYKTLENLDEHAFNSIERLHGHDNYIDLSPEEYAVVRMEERDTMATFFDLAPARFYEPTFWYAATMLHERETPGTGLQYV